MTISWEAVTALATVFTGIVILLTVLVAWRELDQVRRSNQLEGVMKVAETLATERYQTALGFVLHELPARLEDREFVDELGTPASKNEKRHPEIVVLMEHELVGVYIKHGLISGDAVYDLCGPRFVKSWSVLKRIVQKQRESTGNPDAWENAEWLSLDAQRWTARRR